MKLSGDIVSQVERLKYLGSVLKKNGGFEDRTGYKCNRDKNVKVDE